MSSPNIRVLATDLAFPEGPVVMPDGSVILVEIRAQQLTRVWPDGRKEVVAKIPGGPNGAALGPDGKMYLCNNGGFSWAASRGAIRAAGNFRDHFLAAIGPDSRQLLRTDFNQNDGPVRHHHRAFGECEIGGEDADVGTGHGNSLTFSWFVIAPWVGDAA